MTCRIKFIVQVATYRFFCNPSRTFLKTDCNTYIHFVSIWLL